LYLEAVRPDPIMDSTPRITGSCSDNSLYDTNSQISQLRYRVDSGEWQSITPLDLDYGDQSESFSFDLPEQLVATHTIEVECTDSQNLVSTKSDEFSVIEPVDADPQIITETEDFVDHSNHVLSESNLIWGNGKLRLRETISTVRTSIDTTNYPSKYENTYYNRYDVKADPANENLVWYARTGEVVSYNISNNQINVLDPTDWGLSEIGTPIQVVRPAEYNGKSYLWVADFYTLQIYNFTDNQAIEYPMYEIQDLAPDTERNHLGAYIVMSGDVRY